MSTTQTTTVTVHIPTPLRRYTEEQASVALEGSTVGDVLHRLADRFPQLKQHLFGDDGSLRSFVNVYLDDEDIRYLDKEETAVEAGDELSIVPSIAGGCC